MTASPSLTHAQLADVLARLRLGVGASDLHGSLTGFLCAGGHADEKSWLTALELDSDPAAGDPYEALAPVYQECAAALDDPELRFEPLLPASETTLDARADALVEWCRGFLGGMGLAGSGPRQTLTPDATEILDDFGTIAGSRFEYENAEEDENALAEVVEFVRVGVLLLHTEMTSPPRGAATTLH